MMYKRDFKEVIDQIAFDIKRAFQYLMESERGINNKINENTLVDSHIYDELEVNQTDIGLYTILINDYVDYIESGMQPGHWVKEDYLIPWMVDKGIPTDNETIKKVQGSIYWYGIEPRPFVEDSFERIESFWDEWADELFESLCAELDIFFDE